LAYPVQANEVFAVLPRAVHAGLQSAGAYYYEWPGEGPSGERAAGENEVLVRLVTSFKTPVSDVDDFLALLSRPTVEA
jgi:threonine aldolase